MESKTSFCRQTMNLGMELEYPFPPGYLRPSRTSRSCRFPFGARDCGRAHFPGRECWGRPWQALDFAPLLIGHDQQGRVPAFAGCPLQPRHERSCLVLTAADVVGKENHAADASPTDPREECARGSGSRESSDDHLPEHPRECRW